MSGSAFRVLRRAAARLWVPCRLWLALAVIAGMAAAPLAADPAPGGKLSAVAVFPICPA
jgi:hypothetical protein